MSNLITDGEIEAFRDNLTDAADSFFDDDRIAELLHDGFTPEHAEREMMEFAKRKEA